MTDVYAEFAGKAVPHPPRPDNGWRRYRIPIDDTAGVRFGVPDLVPGELGNVREMAGDPLEEHGVTYNVGSVRGRRPRGNAASIRAISRAVKRNGSQSKSGWSLVTPLAGAAPPDSRTH